MWFAIGLIVVACSSPAPTQSPVGPSPSAPVQPSLVLPSGEPSDDPAPSPSTATPGASTLQPSAGSPTPGSTDPGTPRPTLEPVPTPDEGSYQPVVVDSFGFTPINTDGNDFSSWAAVFTNPNTEWAIFRMPVQIEFYGADDLFLGGDELYVTILPGQTTAIAGQGGTAATTRFVVTPADDPTPYVPLISSGTVEITDVESVATDIGRLTTGSLTSTLTTDQTFMPIIAVYRDAAGNILGGTNSGVESLPSGATVQFEIPDSLPPPNIATTEVYWQLGRRLPQ